MNASTRPLSGCSCCPVIRPQPAGGLVSRRNFVAGGIAGLGLGATVDQPTAHEALEDRHRNVAAAVKVQEQGFGLSLLRHKADTEARPDRVFRRGKRDGGAINLNAAAGEGGRPEKGPKELLLAHALQARNAQNLARMQVEGDVAQALGGRNPALRSPGDGIGRR